MRRPAFFLVLTLSTAWPAWPAAVSMPTPYDRAIAAGYKALMLCGAIYNGGRTQEQAEALELTGIYPEYAPLLPELKAEVERDSATVSVPWSEVMPPRSAAWRPKQGCVIRPLGWAMLPDAEPPRIRHLSPLEAQPTDAQPWPMGDAAAQARKLPRKLAPVAAKAFINDGFGAGTRTTGVVVVQGGKIVAEQYAEGFTLHTAQRTWSVAQSLTGTLLGMSAQQGWLRIDNYAAIPEWDRPMIDPRKTITVDHLLHMSSGLHTATDGRRTDDIEFGGSSVQEVSTSWPAEVAPGTRFRYSNTDILLAVRALRASMPSEAEYQAFPAQMFTTLGMTRTVAERDWRGNFVLSSQVWSTARDLARFGLLYLNEGVWQGERLLPVDWEKYVAKPAGPQPDPATPEGQYGYGMTFWLLNHSAGVPADTFAAWGDRGQFVIIVPSRQVVIVRRGEDPTGSDFDFARFTAEVLAAL
jgi:CubicO group peptidase (beta-lactamase class C family)